MTPELRDRVVNRLVDMGVSNEERAFIILAALEGPALPATTSSAAKPAAEPPGVYVTSLTVEPVREAVATAGVEKRGV
jgi:hypothetical protein